MCTSQVGIACNAFLKGGEGGQREWQSYDSGLGQPPATSAHHTFSACLWFCFLLPFSAPETSVILENSLEEVGTAEVLAMRKQVWEGCLLVLPSPPGGVPAPPVAGKAPCGLPSFQQGFLDLLSTPALCLQLLPLAQCLAADLAPPLGPFSFLLQICSWLKSPGGFGAWRSDTWAGARRSWWSTPCWSPWVFSTCGFGCGDEDVKV